MPADNKLNQVGVPTVVAVLAIVLMLEETNKASSAEYILDLASVFFFILHSHGTDDNFVYKIVWG